jgi:hypothetical protein
MLSVQKFVYSTDNRKAEVKIAFSHISRDPRAKNEYCPSALPHTILQKISLQHRLPVCRPRSVHGCSEIGLKWFLFAFHDLRKVLGFVSVLDFFE